MKDLRIFSNQVLLPKLFVKSIKADRLLFIATEKYATGRKKLKKKGSSHETVVHAGFYCFNFTFIACFVHFSALHLFCFYINFFFAVFHFSGFAFEITSV